MKEDLSPRLRALGSPEFRRNLLESWQKASIREAKILVPQKTRNLHRTIREGPISGNSARILAGGISDVGYAAHVEFGTREHDIRPRSKKALSFPSQYALNRSAALGLVKSGSTVKFRLSGTITAASQKRYGSAAYTTVKHVHHPGTQAHPYLRPGAQRAMAKVGVGPIVKAWNGAA